MREQLDIVQIQAESEENRVGQVTTETLVER